LCPKATKRNNILQTSRRERKFFYVSLSYHTTHTAKAERRAEKQRQRRCASSLHVEYAERGKYYGILSIFSLFCEYIQFEYVRLHVIYRGTQAEYGIHIHVAAPQEYVNTYSTRRASSGYKTKIGIEGEEDPAAAGIERFFSLKGPRAKKIVRASLIKSRQNCLCVFCVGPLCGPPFGGGSSAGSSPLCGSPVGGALPWRVPVSRGICSSSCLLLVLTLSL